MLTVSCTGTS